MDRVQLSLSLEDAEYLVTVLEKAQVSDDRALFALLNLRINIQKEIEDTTEKLSSRDKRKHARKNRYGMKEV